MDLENRESCDGDDPLPAETFPSPLHKFHIATRRSLPAPPETANRHSCWTSSPGKASGDVGSPAASHRSGRAARQQEKTQGKKDKKWLMR